ncbi:MAG TPA: hypothetical protein VLK65_28500 [Vicinamibacteria bacterium]|nr:hypothetical protein [Vicinamibacteria bacterium]
MKTLSAVLVSLQDPREKVWGILLSVETSGITLRGIHLNSFDDWSRAVARGETDMQLSTVFFPLHRVERIDRDESVGRVPSLSDTFEDRVGQDVWSFLGLDAIPPETSDDAGPRMTLREVERAHVKRVLDDCHGDREAAARILDVPEAELDAHLDPHIK